MAVKQSIMLYPDQPTLFMLSTRSSDAKSGTHNWCSLCEELVEPRFDWFSLLTPAIAVPFYYTAVMLSLSPLTVVALFTNSFLMALTCVVLFCFAASLYNSKKIAFVLTLIFGVCSFIWDYNNALLSEPTQALVLLASAYFIYLSTRRRDVKEVVVEGSADDSSSVTTTSILATNKKNVTNRIALFAALAGMFLGLSLVSHGTNILIIPGFLAFFILAIRRNVKRRVLLVSFMAAFVAVLVLQGYTNYVRFGSFTEFGYGSEAQSLSIHNSWTGLVGLLISPGKALIIYFPVAILLPLAFRYLYTKDRGVFFLCLYPFIAMWLFYGTWNFPNSLLSDVEIWSGGWWGARYLVPVLPFLTLPLGTLLIDFKGKIRYLMRFAVVALSIVGFSVNLIGVLVFFYYVDDYAYKTGFTQGKNALEIMTWNPYHSYLVKYVEVLGSNYPSQFEPVKYHISSFTLAPCSFDNYIYCKHGIVPILLLSIVIAGVATMILYKISTSKHILFFRNRST